MQTKKNNKTNATASFEGRLPSSKEMEETVLGMLLTESTAINAVSDILHPGVFFYPQNGAVYEAIRSVSEEGNAPDMMLVYAWLTRNCKLEEVGGPIYLAQLTARVSSDSNIERHALYLQQLYIARQLVTAGTKIAAMGYDSTLDVDDSIAESFRLLESVSGEMANGANTFDLRALSSQSMQLYQLRKENASGAGKRVF